MDVDGEGVKNSVSESKISITDTMKNLLKTKNSCRQQVFTVINKLDLNCQPVQHPSSLLENTFLGEKRDFNKFCQPRRAESEFSSWKFLEAAVSFPSVREKEKLAVVAQQCYCFGGVSCSPKQLKCMLNEKMKKRLVFLYWYRIVALRLGRNSMELNKPAPNLTCTGIYHCL